MSDTFEAPAVEPEVTASPAAEQGVPAENPAEAATADEPEDEAQGADADEPKKLTGINKRLKELTDRVKDARQERDHWREMAARQVGLEPQAPQGQAPQAQQLPPDIAQWLGAEPKPADFPAGEFDPNFTRAAARFDMKVEQAKQEVQRRQGAAQRQAQEFHQRVSAVMDEATKADPSLSAVLADRDFPMPPKVVHELMQCEQPATVLAYLGANPTEARRIADLPTASAVARALDRLETRLTATPAPKPTNAPAPPPLARGRAFAPADLSKMSMEQYAAHRRG